MQDCVRSREKNSLNVIHGNHGSYLMFENKNHHTTKRAYREGLSPVTRKQAVVSRPTMTWQREKRLRLCTSLSQSQSLAVDQPAVMHSKDYESSYHPNHMK